MTRMHAIFTSLVRHRSACIKRSLQRRQEKARKNELVGELSVRSFKSE